MATNNAVNRATVVSSVATSGLASGGPITETGTVTVTAATQSDMETATSITTAVTPKVQHFHPGHPKGWCLASVTGTAVSSYNVTSVSDVGVGDVTVNWTLVFSSANVCYVASIKTDSNYIVAVANVTTDGSTVRLSCKDTSAVVQDPNQWMVTAFGDFAS
jgi:hypothetical protein